jgi:predicted acetyltransferase
VVQELHALDPEATAALWRFVTDVDLATTTVAGRRATDDPVLALVADEGRARVSGTGRCRSGCWTCRRC